MKNSKYVHLMFVKKNLKKEFNGPTAVQSLRTIVSKTQWELRWDSLRKKFGWSPPLPGLRL